MRVAAVSGQHVVAPTVDQVAGIAEAGYVTVPLCGPGPHTHRGVDCPSRGKRPLLSGWQKRRVPLSQAEIEENWAGKDAGRNVGVVCNGLLVVDCDTRGGVDGARELEALFEAHGDRSPSATVETGGGGLHFYFRLPDGVETPKNSASALGPGVDVKTGGGMVVSPPSVHASGGRYRWRTPDGGPPARDGLPVAPAWLLELLARPPAGEGLSETVSVPVAVPDPGAAKLVETHLVAVRGTKEGARNDALNRAAFCFGQLDGACRIDAEAVRADLWGACAGYRADEGDAAAEATIASGWEAGRESPLYREGASGTSPRGAGSGNGSAPGVPGGLALGVYRLDGSGGLGLEPLGGARRLLDSHSEKLMIAWSGGGTTDREAAIYTLASSGLWTRDPARLGSWHCARALWWETRVGEAAGGWKLPEKERKQVVKSAKRYLKDARHPKGREKCLDSLPVLVSHLAERGELPDGLTQCEVGELDGTRWLGAPNGVIDLHTGRLLPAKKGRGKLVTGSLPDPYVPDASHPDVDRLTAHLSGELAGYVWDMLAYALHGQPARTFVVLTGTTGGGKSTLARAVQAALGPGYAGALADGAITPQRGGRGANQATPDMETVMAPRRVAFSPEVENLRPDPTRLKALTGGDQQAWRPLYGNPRYGVPTASVWLLGNKPPTGLGLTDPAMLERVRAIPYPEVPKNARDPALVEAFHGTGTEARKRRQALTAKLVKRATALAPGSPPEPALAVLEAVDALRDDDLGPIGCWLRDNVQKGSPEEVLTSAGLWAALHSELGAAADADRVEGLTRTQVVTLARSVHRLPKADRVTTPTGQRVRGWPGWKLVADADS